MVVGRIISAFVIVVALLIGVMIIDEMGQTNTAGGEDTQITRQAATLWDSSGFVTLGNGRGDGETVYETTGYAVELSGASDSYVQTDSEISVSSDKNWTVSVWGRVASGQSGADMTLLSLNGRVVISYNGSQNQWSAWYYEEDDRDSHRVNVSLSGNEVGNYTNLQVLSNGTHFTIYRNGTQGESVALSTDQITTAPTSNGNWNGEIEEIRLFDTALSSANRTLLVNEPTEERPNLDTTARIMFDQPDKASQLVLFTQAMMSQSNVGFDSGFSEVTSQDYDWESVGPEVRATGDLSDAPVLYASYSFNQPGLADALIGFATFVQIAALVPIVIIGIIIVSLLRE